MVQAILDGRKTQTRRVVKDKTLQENNGKHDEEFLLLTMKNCPYGKVGDVLWVRETFAYYVDEAGYTHFDKYIYKADNSDVCFRHADGFSTGKSGWKPSIFMPKSACRIFLEITSIRVECLQDISEEDAKAEGVNRTNAVNEWYFMENVYNTDSALIAFERLWQSINGSWNDNPWVWVIEFKQVKTQNNE